MYVISMSLCHIIGLLLPFIGGSIHAFVSPFTICTISDEVDVLELILAWFRHYEIFHTNLSFAMQVPVIPSETLPERPGEPDCPVR